MPVGEARKRFTERVTKKTKGGDSLVDNGTILTQIFLMTFFWMSKLSLVYGGALMFKIPRWEVCACKSLLVTRRGDLTLRHTLSFCKCIGEFLGSVGYISMRFLLGIAFLSTSVAKNYNVCNKDIFCRGDEYRVITNWDRWNCDNVETDKTVAFLTKMTWKKEGYRNMKINR